MRNVRAKRPAPAEPAERAAGGLRYGSGVGFYREQVLPRLMERACSRADMTIWRAKVTEGLEGRVVEIGFGSGLNLAHYPATVDVVLAVEPAAVARRLAARRVASSRVAVEHVGLDGQSIPLPDAGSDAALSTFTLCSIPDVHRALLELRRVIRPGGRFHFLEHGLAPDPGVVLWQRRLEPLQRRLADGCHLTRDIPAIIADAGFVIEHVEQRYAKGPRPWSWFTVGAALNPG
jgi:SAM-dependent methyltransferase